MHERKLMGAKHFLGVIILCNVTIVVRAGRMCNTVDVAAARSRANVSLLSCSWSEFRSLDTI